MKVKTSIFILIYNSVSHDDHKLIHLIINNELRMTYNFFNENEMLLSDMKSQRSKCLTFKLKCQKVCVCDVPYDSLQQTLCITVKTKAVP